jgi:hypothetical protein
VQPRKPVTLATQQVLLDKPPQRPRQVRLEETERTGEPGNRDGGAPAVGHRHNRDHTEFRIAAVSRAGADLLGHHIPQPLPTGEQVGVLQRQPVRLLIGLQPVRRRGGPAAGQLAMDAGRQCLIQAQLDHGTVSQGRQREQVLVAHRAQQQDPRSAGDLPLKRVPRCQGADPDPIHDEPDGSSGAGAGRVSKTQQQVDILLAKAPHPIPQHVPRHIGRHPGYGRLAGTRRAGDQARPGPVQPGQHRVHRLGSRHRQPSRHMPRLHRDPLIKRGVLQRRGEVHRLAGAVSDRLQQRQPVDQPGDLIHPTPQVGPGQPNPTRPARGSVGIRATSHLRPQHQRHRHDRPDRQTRLLRQHAGGLRLGVRPTNNDRAHLTEHPGDLGGRKPTRDPRPHQGVAEAIGRAECLLQGLPPAARRRPGDRPLEHHRQPGLRLRRHPLSMPQPSVDHHTSRPGGREVTHACLPRLDLHMPGVRALTRQVL